MKKWFKRITAGAVAAVVFGMALMPQGESRAAAARIQVSVPENRVPAYEQGETKTFVLEVKNNGPDELKNIKAVPRLEGEEGQWPFATDYQSYEEGKESMAPGETWQASFGFTARGDAALGRYRVVFDVSATGSGGEDIGGSSSFYVNVTANESGKEPDGSKPQGGAGESWQGAGGAQDGPAGWTAAREVQTEGGSMAALAGSFENGPVTGGGQASSGTVPRVIVTGFDTDPGEVKAGTDFKLTIHLKNTSKASRVSNLLFELAAPTEGRDEQTTAPAFLPASGASSLYLDQIGAGGTADISIQLNAKADLVQKPYSINLAMKYEDQNAAQIEAQSSISIPVRQEARFEFSDFEVTPTVISPGEESNVSCSLYNMGRVKLYNVKALFEGKGIKKEELFVGSVEPGASAAIDAMLEGEKKTKGPEKVKMTVTYEDEAGKISKAEKELQLEVAEAVETTEWDEADMKPAPSFPFVPVAAAVLAAAAGTTAAVIWKRKKRAAEEEVLYELDGPSEDE